MTFAHDTEVSLTFAAALVNADLPDLPAFEEFMAQWTWSGVRRHDLAELAAVQALRPRLRRFWETEEDEAVALANAMLREGAAVPQLVRHDEYDYHLHATPDDTDLDIRMMVEAAMAMLDVLRMKELDRLRVCSGEDCTNVLVDLTKNRSRRFCESGCGNRANVAAYRARRAATS